MAVSLGGESGTEERVVTAECPETILIDQLLAGVEILEAGPGELLAPYLVVEIPRLPGITSPPTSTASTDSRTGTDEPDERGRPKAASSPRLPPAGGQQSQQPDGGDQEGRNPEARLPSEGEQGRRGHQGGADGPDQTGCRPEESGHRGVRGSSGAASYRHCRAPSEGSPGERGRYGAQLQ